MVDSPWADHIDMEDGEGYQKGIGKDSDQSGLSFWWGFLEGLNQSDNENQADKKIECCIEKVASLKGMDAVIKTERDAGDQKDS